MYWLLKKQLNASQNAKSRSPVVSSVTLVGTMLSGEMIMSNSMYAVTVPPIIHSLTNLRVILEKAASHAEAKKIDPSVLVHARLYSDMFPLSRQVQIPTDVAKGAVSRLAGLEPPKYDDNESTFAELLARIDKTIALLKSFKAEQIDETEGKIIVLLMHDKTVEFKGLAYSQWQTHR
ncbi:DUF1993 domain-containing protein [Methylomonas sp. LW13]|uniref:DUF1993 domain-containing protein n=2 Tax=unclassified Methylomonas TaxID=2608980 RepID=UPI001CEC1C48|nr:DUF1993 domain-containing protein [Methylomonas sp. LW13]